MKQEFRYYTPLVMGFVLMLIGIFTPPVGSLSAGILYGVAMFLILAGGVIGLDIPEILKQVNELKRLKLEELKVNGSNTNNE